MVYYRKYTRHNVETYIYIWDPLFTCTKRVHTQTHFPKRIITTAQKHFPELKKTVYIYFFLAFSSLSLVLVTLPSMTAVFPSRKAIRERPSQRLKLSTTKACVGTNSHCATSLDLRLWGSSIFLPPVSLPIFQSILDILQEERPQRTKPMGEYPTLSSPGMSRVWIWAVKLSHALRDSSFL